MTTNSLGDPRSGLVRGLRTESRTWDQVNFQWLLSSFQPSELTKQKKEEMVQATRRLMSKLLSYYFLTSRVTAVPQQLHWLGFVSLTN